MRRKSLALVAAFGVVVAASSAPATAGSPGTWSRLSPAPAYANFGQVGLQRTEDGTLHSIWVRPNATTSSNNDLVHTSIAPGGAVGTTTSIVENVNFIWPVVDLVADGDQLRAFWYETANGLQTSTSADGLTWTPAAEVLPNGGDVGAAMAGGSPYQTFTGGGIGVVVHPGLDPNTPHSSNYQSQLGGGDAYNPDLATDLTDGSLWIGWYSTASDPTDSSKCRCGVYVQEVDLATGSPVGTPMRMPRSASEFNGGEVSVNHGVRTPMVSRLGGGVYVAYTSGYPDTNKMIVWRIGDPDSYTVASVQQGWFKAPAIASAPGGRLWVVWAGSDGKIYASASNTAGTAWTPAVSAAAPGSAALASPYNLAADGTDTGVDVVANYPITNGVAYFHTQFRTPLEWTSGDDTLTGTSSADFIYGGPGNDILKGAGGRDDVYGGKGNDKLNGGPGKDKLNGGKGTDVCIFTKGDKMSGCEKKKRAH